MPELLLSPDLMPYWVAAGLLITLVAVGMVSLHTGASAIHLEGVHLDGAATDVGADLAHGGAVDHGGSILGWLNLGRVPLLVLIMTLLGTFAAAGFVVVMLLHRFGLAAPWVVTAPLATVAAVVSTRGTTRLIARVLPRDETYVSSTDDFIGATAEITLGPARAGVVAVARLKDRFGNWHFPHVEPLRPGTEISEGSVVLVVARRDSVLLVVPAEGRLAQRPV
jgi:hypothetical protein